MREKWAKSPEGIFVIIGLNNNGTVETFDHLLDI